jgi:hypothetical protein
MLLFMPKPSKTRPKPKSKKQLKNEAEVPGITTRKSYWVVLAAVLAVVSAVFGLTMGLDALQVTVLVAAVVVPIGTIGYIKVSPSELALGKRATLLFMGVSVIGFGIWAAIVLVGGVFGVTAQMTNALGSQFFIVTSLAVCLAVGALAGELIGRSKAVQIRLFSALDEKQ